MASVNRKFDVAAMTAIAEHVIAKGELVLPMEDEATARRTRLQFYLWRKKEQELSADQTLMSDISCRIAGSTVYFDKGFGNALLRAALAKAGIVVKNDDDLDLDEEELV